jgi:hypothetical protein
LQARHLGRRLSPAGDLPRDRTGSDPHDAVEPADAVDNARKPLAPALVRDPGDVPLDRPPDGLALGHVAVSRPEGLPDADAHVSDGHDDPLLGHPGLVALGGDEPAGGRAGMLDHVQAQLTGGLEQLVDDLAVGSALEPFPDERGQAIAAMRVVEPLQLDQGVPPIAFGNPWEGSLDLRPERVDDGADSIPRHRGPGRATARRRDATRPGRSGDGSA